MIHNNYSTSRKEILWVGVSVAFAAISFWYIFSWFRADMLYSKGAGEEDLLQSALTLEKAIGFWRWESAYHRELALVYARLASAYQDEKQEKFLEFAGYSAEEAYELNPRNMLTLKSLITTYYVMSGLDSGYERRVKDLVDEAVILCPADPTVWYLKGVVYSGFGQEARAKEALRKALELRPGYPEARQALEVY